MTAFRLSLFQILIILTFTEMWIFETVRQFLEDLTLVRYQFLMHFWCFYFFDFSDQAYARAYVRMPWHAPV